LPVGIDSPASAVRASARSFGGALYVIAVNAGTSAATVQLNAPGLAGRPLRVDGDGSRLVQSNGSDFVAVLPAMSVRIYTAAPPGAG
jgi:hypothetical protein